jgi:hypothetical protein
MAIHVNRPAIQRSPSLTVTRTPQGFGETEPESWQPVGYHRCLVQAQALPLCFLVGASLSGLYRMVALNGLQVNETTDRQPLLVALSLINHSVNMLGEYLSRLQKDGLITLL